MSNLAQRTMFAMFDEPVPQSECRHPFEIESITLDDERLERMTWTCESCGNVRGRVTTGKKPPTWEQTQRNRGLFS